MKSLNYLLILVFSIALFNSCKKEQVITASNGNIQFSNLAVGQKSFYIGFRSRMPWSDSDTAYKPMNDTLTLTIVEKNDTGFRVKEERTDVSFKASFYYFNVVDDSLFVKPSITDYVNSSVFLGGPRSFVLKNNGLSKFTVNKWNVLKDVFSLTGFGVLNDVTVLNKKYETAFMYHNPNAMIFDGEAYTRIYTPEDGFLCFEALGGFAPYGTIFYLVPYFIR
jgi:hypothetical protein